MTGPGRSPVILKVLHSDILLPGEAAATGSGAGSDTVPPTRSEEQSAYPLVGERWVIGRNPDCDIRIRRERTDISRSHATIKREGERFHLYDHSSRGSFVNNQRVDGSHLLDSGDILGFGDSPRMLRFLDPHRSALALTAREHDILRLMAAGQTNKEMAVALHISADTVNTHVGRIFAKLGVHNRTEAVTVAQARGLLDIRAPGVDDR